MVLALLTLLTGLAISAVAIYYSVIGLAAIFSAAFLPIVLMGAILEVSKLVSAWWLKANWYRAPFLLKSYMLVAVVVLMLITSMGIFGFLSKAHTDQALVSGDVQSQVYLIDEQIKIERENISNAQSLIKQMDDVVTGISAGQGRELRSADGSVRIENPAERALSIRRSQARDRAALTAQIETAQAKILELQQKKAPIAAEQRKVEAEVGPIKYIAKLIYGDSADTNLLEKAVTWVIITIVFVFDPLAVLLLLASQMSFQWAREDRAKRKEEQTQSVLQPVESPIQEPEEVVETDLVEECNQKIAEIDKEQDLDLLEEELKNSVLAEPTSTETIDPEPVEDLKRDDDEVILEEEQSRSIKTAMSSWKADHPNDSLKHQRDLLKKGLIKVLPWESDQYLRPQADFQDEAAEEAVRWAQEQIEKQEETKKKDTVTWMERQGQDQIKKSLEK
jgi:hypothetical protein